MIQVMIMSVLHPVSYLLTRWLVQKPLVEEGGV